MGCFVPAVNSTGVVDRSPGRCGLLSADGKPASDDACDGAGPKLDKNDCVAAGTEDPTPPTPDPDALVELWMENLGGDAPSILDAACRVCRAQLSESSPPLPLKLVTLLLM